MEATLQPSDNPPNRDKGNKMNTLTKNDFDQISAKMAGLMVSLDKQTRIDAASDAEALLLDLPKVLANSPHCKGEIDALKKLIATVNAEKQVEIGAHTVQTAFDNAKCKKDFCDWVSAMKKNTSFVFTSEATTLINKLRKYGKRFQVRMSVQDAAQWELKERAGLDPA